MKTPIKKAVRGIKVRRPEKAQMVVQNCTFTGSLDEETCKTIQAVAGALQETAKALVGLSAAFQPAPMFNVDVVSPE